jgi:wobble nucleotide-excising tRNase
VYGWNGSGKTTLSRLFGAIGGIPIKDCEYEIEDENGAVYRHGDGFPQKIRVFNQDYIEANVKILEGRTNSISILLGGDNKDLIEQIQKDKNVLEGDPADPTKLGKQAIVTERLKQKERRSSERDGMFTAIAKTIGAAIGGNALRDYRKPQAEKDFAALSAKAELSEPDLEKCSISAKQESLPTVGLLIPGKIRFETDGAEFTVTEFLKGVAKQAKEILTKTVESELIPRLAAEVDIAAWVEQGVHLHKQHSSEACEFCLQKIPASRLQQLSRHFSEADKELKERIDACVAQLDKIPEIIRSVTLPDRARLYTELRGPFDKKGAQCESAQNLLLTNITNLIAELKNKKAKTTEVVILKEEPRADVWSASVDEVNTLMESHNKTTSDFEAVKKGAIQELKRHYLSTIYDSVQSCKNDIAKCDEEITLLRAEINALLDGIAKKMATISSQHKACDIINEKLATFLGHRELTLVPYSETEAENKDEKESVAGYRIMRGNSPAVHLSEGEKTAIAFVYFVVHLGGQDFSLADGIVVVDDPVSSLDSNSVYQAFSFLKNAVKDAKQVFILTHSFEFLRLLINWRQHAAGGTGYYMIKNRYVNDERQGYIDKMDKELSEYESEYQYLFKLLKQLRDEQDDSIAKAYPIPNIARKVWDTFLMFSVPNSLSQYKKMDVLKEAGHDEQKLDAIYKFTNDQSHITGAGFNPALVPETKKVVKELFEMMAAIAPTHFKIIDSATN